MSIYGWLANVPIVLGLWFVGRKAWWAFLLTFVGEAAWTAVALQQEMWDLAFICVVFAALALRNLYLWRSTADKE